jgi:hypothetical protein
MLFSALDQAEVLKMLAKTIMIRKMSRHQDGFKNF